MERLGAALIFGRRRRFGGGVLAVATAVVCSGVAYGRLSGSNYHGRTSQHRKISLRIVEDLSVQRLRYWIVDACPGGKMLTNGNFGFPRMPIVRGRFGGTFYEHPRDGKIVIRGSTTKRFISGSLSDRTKNTHTHQLCNGHARFRLRLR